MELTGSSGVLHPPPDELHCADLCASGVPTATARYQSQYPRSQVLHAAEPRVHVFRKYFTAEECAHVVQLARSQFKRAGTTGGTTAGRTNSNAWLAHDETPILWAMTQRVAQTVGFRAAQAEKWQVIRYEIKQQYRRHYDGFCPRDTREFRNSVEDSGNRLLTALGYLCDLPSPSSGGATRFTKLGFQVEPELGKLLVFHNCYAAQNADLVAFKTPNADDDGFHCRRIAKRHPLSEHEGMTVHEGEKLAFNLWFREQDTKSGFASTMRQNPGMRQQLDEVLVQARAAHAAGNRVEALALFDVLIERTPRSLLAPRLLDRITRLRVEILQEADMQNASCKICGDRGTEIGIF